MPSQTHELCLEIRDLAAEAAKLLVEFAVSQERCGSGVHRDPAAVLRDLVEEITDLRLAAAEACDGIERAERGLA
jgi:hypothetical protein